MATVCAAADDAADDRMGKLETENADLRARVGQLEQRADAAEMAALEREVESALDEGVGLDLVVRRGDAMGTFQLFGDVGFRYDEPAVDQRANAYFFNGTCDLFFTARVGDHFRGLSETVFLTSSGGAADSSKFDQERLWAAWEFSDLVQLKFGLEHGPISRWNHQFHHGRWLELTVNRPFLARFESDNGILPMHNIGLELSGHLPWGQGQFEYVFILSNGRQEAPTGTGEFSDRNAAKAVDFGVGWRPPCVSGLWIGVFFRIDDIPAVEGNPERARQIRQLIGSFQVDYRADKVEVLAEFAGVQDRDRTSGTNFDHSLGYVQLGYHLDDRWTPYFRIDIRQMDQGDPYYAPLDRDLDIWEFLVGIRFDFIANAALKFEVGFGDREERDGSGNVSNRSYTRVGVQLAWVF